MATTIFQLWTGSATLLVLAVIFTESSNISIFGGRFDWQHPGVLFFKRRINDEEGSFQVFKETTLPTTAAAAITPQGGRMHLEERKGAAAVLQLNDGQMISKLT
ncbi:hypothetical protein CAPTEDRAFT_205431, partial [Capitella teleta]